MTPAEKFITATILHRGPITFKEFMEMALYGPQFGYYTSRRNQIGKTGDYFTSVSLGPLFGNVLAHQLSQMLEIIGGGVLVEMGAGTGHLAMDILDELSEVHYIIVEKSLALVEVQRDLLRGRPVEWVDDLTQLDSVSGVLFSNELVDAFPVHVVEVGEEGLREVLVDWEAGEFREVLGPPTTPMLEEYFQELGVNLPVGFRTEVNLKALEWLRDVSSCLERGFLITMDYGYPSSELYQGYRSKGTLMCYHRHQTEENPYLRVGEQDITTHVNFSALAHWGRKCGLEVTGFTDQAHFLLDMGILDLLSGGDNAQEVRQRLEAKTLLMPGGMGEIFKILIQHKGVESPQLQGLSSAPKKGLFRL